MNCISQLRMSTAMTFDRESLIFLGDLIDRAPEAEKEKLMQPQPQAVGT